MESVRLAAVGHKDWDQVAKPDHWRWVALGSEGRRPMHMVDDWEAHTAMHAHPSDSRRTENSKHRASADQQVRRFARQEVRMVLRMDLVEDMTNNFAAAAAAVAVAEAGHTDTVRWRSTGIEELAGVEE